MINHARTLLLNRKGSTRPGTEFYLEELVPEDFQEIKLSGALISVRSVLFGANPDLAFMNYRLAQYVRILHSTEYVGYITDLDPRVTYLTDRSVVPTSWSVVVNPVTSGAYLSAVDVLGNFYGQEGECRIDYPFTIEIPTAGAVTATNDITKEESTNSFTITGGMSELFPLPGNTEMGFRLKGNPAVLSKWSVAIRKQPDADLSGIITKMEKSGSLWDSLLTGGEPYKTFRQLWEKSPYLSYRLTGVLLAVIYRTEALKNA